VTDHFSLPKYNNRVSACVGGKETALMGDAVRNVNYASVNSGVASRVTLVPARTSARVIANAQTARSSDTDSHQ